MVHRSVQSKIHRRLRATPDRLPAFRFPLSGFLFSPSAFAFRRWLR
jgi:hypothetical protein